MRSFRQGRLGLLALQEMPEKDAKICKVSLGATGLARLGPFDLACPARTWRPTRIAPLEVCPTPRHRVAALN